MKRSLMLFAVLFSSLVLMGQASAQAPDDALPEPSDRLSQLLDPTRMAKQVTGMLDAYLDFLAKPETAAKLAKFQKNYYDALVEEGFTAEQAFQLVRDGGNPLIGNKANR